MENSNTGKGALIYVDDKPIAEATAMPIDIVETEWEFYMRRGNKHYFRSCEGKMAISANELIFMGMRYGDQVTFEIRNLFFTE